MISVLCVSIGGFFGAISRYALNNLIQNRNKTDFPLGTLTINVTGAFLLGLLVGLKIASSLYTALGIGFMGAFTTFSTLMLETEKLDQSNKKLAYSYLAISVLLGIPLAYCGILFGTYIK